MAQILQFDNRMAPHPNMTRWEEIPVLGRGFKLHTRVLIFEGAMPDALRKRIRREGVEAEQQTLSVATAV